MTTDVFKDVRAAWHRFLQNLEIIRHHNTIYAMQPSGPIPNPLLDMVLPSILTINLVSFLDESLEEFISHKGIVGRRRRLCDRINLLDRAGFLVNAPLLHDLRDIRNRLAHTDVFVEWEDLDTYVDLVDATLQHLGLTEERPKYDYFFERKSDLTPDKDIVIRFLYRYGLKRDDKEVLVIEVPRHHYGVGKGPSSVEE